MNFAKTRRSKSIVARKAFVFVVSIVLFATLLITNYAAVPADSENHWARAYIERIIGMGAINGYPNGTFRPDNKITNAEFVKILVSIEDKNIREAVVGEHWSQRYFDRAMELGIINSNEKAALFPNREYDKAITRGHIALLISKVIKEKYDDVDDYSYQIRDLKANARRKSYEIAPIALVYRAGIVGGYPGGRFEASKGSTRAEAATMLMRYVDPTLRQEREKHVSMLGIDEFTPEQIAKGSYDFVFSVYFRHDAELQYEHAREYMLEKGVPTELADKVIEITKTKEGKPDVHFRKVLKWGEKGNIRLDGGYRTQHVTIYFHREVKKLNVTPVFD